MAVDACSGVPARGGLLGVVDADGDDVFACVKVWREVVVEADVAVGAMAEEFAVAVDVGVGHDAVEGDVGAFRGVEFWQRERMAIPGDAGGEEASGCAAWGVFFNRACDAPVVRKGDGLPLRVVERRRLGVGGVGLGEAPVGVEGWMTRGCIRCRAAKAWVVRRAVARRNVGRMDSLSYWLGEILLRILRAACEGCDTRLFARLFFCGGWCGFDRVVFAG